MQKRSRLILLVLLFGLLSALNIAQAQDTATTLRVAWWGNDARHEMYNRLADMYEELHPNITIEREFAGWAEYWERLATQTAGGNAPDVIHMHHAYIGEYSSRGVLADLAPLVESGAIDLTNVPEGIVNSGRFDDTLYMVSLGNSASGTHYNTRLFTEAGIEPPTYEWTWDDFVATTLALSEALGPEVYGSYDSGGWDGTLEFYMNQLGYPLFTEDDQLGFPREALIAYWTMWQGLREAGAIPPIEMTIERGGDGPETNMLVTGDVALFMLSGNQHRLYQNNTEDELGLTTLPRSTDSEAPAGDVVTGAYIAISAGTEHPEEAAAFINWMINNDDVARIYNGEHGPPASVLMQEAIAEQQGPADLRLAAMMQFIAPTAGSPGYRPAGAGEVLSAFTRIYQELALGQHASVEDAVNAFFDEADFILN